MPIQLSGTQSLTHAGKVMPDGFPRWMLVAYANAGSTANTFSLASQILGGENFHAIRMTNFGEIKSATHRNPTGVSVFAAKTGTPHPNSSALQWAVAVWTSLSSRTIYFGDNTGVTDTNSSGVTDVTASQTEVCIGALQGVFDPVTGHLAEAHFGGGTALSSTDVGDLIAGTKKPEELPGWVDGWQLKTTSDLTSMGGSRSLTVTGTLSNSGLAHPVTRSTPSVFTGNITLDAVGTSGTFQGVAAGAFAGAITLDDVGVTGSFGASSGTLTSEPLRTNNGTLLASTALAHVAIYNDTTGALVLRRTSISTDGAGVFTITDPAIVAGTTYRIDWETSGGHRRMPRKAAA